MKPNHGNNIYENQFKPRSSLINFQRANEIQKAISKVTSATNIRGSQGNKKSDFEKTMPLQSIEENPKVNNILLKDNSKNQICVKIHNMKHHSSSSTGNANVKSYENLEQQKNENTKIIKLNNNKIEGKEIYEDKNEKIIHKKENANIEIAQDDDEEHFVNITLPQFSSVPEGQELLWRSGEAVPFLLRDGRA